MSELLDLAEELLRDLAEASPLPVLVADPRVGDILLANRHAEELFGRDLVGLRFEELIPPRLRAVHLEHVEDFMARPRARMMGHVPPIPALRADGTEFSATVGLAPAGHNVVIAFRADDET